MKERPPAEISVRRGRPIKMLKLDREHKKIRSFQARPLKFRGAQGMGFNSIQILLSKK